MYDQIGYRNNLVLDRKTFVTMLRALKTVWLEGQGDREADTKGAFCVAAGDADDAGEAEAKVEPDYLAKVIGQYGLELDQEMMRKVRAEGLGQRSWGWVKGTPPWASKQEPLR